MNSWNATTACEQVAHIVVPLGQCDFVRDVPDCQNNGSYINYLEFLYCSVEDGHPGYVPILQLVAIIVALFLLLGTTAGEYLCPALLNISRTLNMSQSVAGVTLLAFGNGAPDIVSIIAGVGQNRSSLIIGELFGSALYICTTVIGLLILLNDFDIPKMLLRDVTFYLAASLWAFHIFHRGYVELKDALGFLALYVIYVVISVVPPLVINRLRDSGLLKHVLTQGKFSASDDGYSSEERADMLFHEPITMISPTFRGRNIAQRRFSSSLSLHRHFENAICTFTAAVDQEIRDCTGTKSARNSLCEGSLHLTRCPSKTDRASFFVGSQSYQESTPLLASTLTHVQPTRFIFPKVYSEWEELIIRLWPVQAEDWRKLSWPGKLYHIAVFPLLLPLVLTIPVVDEHHRRSNWSRPLNVFQCTIAPVVVLALTKSITHSVHGTPIWTIGLIAGCIFGMIVLGSSTNDKPPPYFAAFSFLGFGMSLVWIYRLVTEVVSILKVFGIYFAVSEEVLGASVLTWGNYLGDLVTNLSVASQGYPEMALSACLSTSLVALLVGFGIAFVSRFVTSEDLQIHSRIQVQGGNMLDAIYISLLASMILLTLGACLSRFRSNKLIGCLLLAFYLFFVVTIVIKEFGVLRTFFIQPR